MEFRQKFILYCVLFVIINLDLELSYMGIKYYGLTETSWFNIAGFNQFGLAWAYIGAFLILIFVLGIVEMIGLAVENIYPESLWVYELCVWIGIALGYLSIIINNVYLIVTA